MALNEPIFEKLRKALHASVRIRIDRIRDILGMERAFFNNIFVDWARDFGFIIDGGYVALKEEIVDYFIAKVSELELSDKEITPIYCPGDGSTSVEIIQEGSKRLYRCMFCGRLWEKQ